MTDTIDRPVVDLDDDVLEPPVGDPTPDARTGSRVPAALGDGALPARSGAATFEDAVPESVPVRTPWRWPWQGVRVSARCSSGRPPGPGRVSRRGCSGSSWGAFGLHRMYLGYWRRGLTMLAITVVGGFFTLGLAALAMGLWGFAEGLLVLSVRRGRYSRDAYGKPLRG